MPYQRDFSKRIKVAVIGAGSHCIRNILPVMNYLPVELVAICDTNAQIAEKTAAQYGCRAYSSTNEMYESEKTLEAVFIAVGQGGIPGLSSRRSMPECMCGWKNLSQSGLFRLRKL